MSIRPDTWILKMAKEHRMIEPFIEEQVRNISDRPVISYGLSSFGYDIRVSNKFRIFTNVYGTVIDPKNFDPNPDKFTNSAAEFIDHSKHQFMKVIVNTVEELLKFIKC